MPFSYCSFRTENCVFLSITAFISLPVLLILYILRNINRIQVSVKRLNQEEIILTRIIYLKLGGCFTIFVVSFVQLILSFFL